MQSSDLVLGHLKKFLKQAPGTIEGKGIEPLHRMRVASRRLRVGLRIFQDIYRAGKVKKFRKRLSKIGRVLGKARELDIQLKFLAAQQRLDIRASHARGLAKIRSLLEKKRSKAQKKVVSVICWIQKKDCLSGLKPYIKERSVKGRAKAQERLSQAASCMMLTRLKALMSYAAYVKKPREARKLHLMRIAAKNLRYTLEFFKPFYGPEVNRKIKSAELLQDVLGDLHEMDVWLGFLPGLERRAKDKNLKEASAYLRARCLVLRDEVYKKFVKTWADLLAAFQEPACQGSGSKHHGVVPKFCLNNIALR